MIQTDKEKIEEVLRIVNKSLEIGKTKGSRPDKKTTIVYLQDNMKAIKKILESDEDDGWTPGVVNERTDSKGNKY